MSNPRTESWPEVDLFSHKNGPFWRQGLSHDLKSMSNPKMNHFTIHGGKWTILQFYIDCRSRDNPYRPNGPF